MVPMPILIPLDAENKMEVPMKSASPEGHNGYFLFLSPSFTFMSFLVFLFL